MNQFISFRLPNGDSCTYHYTRIIGYTQVDEKYTDLQINWCGEEKIVRVWSHILSVHSMINSVKAAV